MKEVFRMTKLNKRISILLAVVITITSLIVPVYADNTVASDSGVYISICDKLYPVTKGDTYTYEYRLNLGKKLTAIDASLSYDVSGLELVNYSFPILGDSTNTGTYGGKLYFNYSNQNGIMFGSNTEVLIRATFKVTASTGAYDIHTDIKDMARYQEVKIVDNGVVITDFTCDELITDDDSQTSIYINTGNKYYKVKRGKTYNYICYLQTDDLVGNLVAYTDYSSYELSTSSSTRTTYHSYSGKSFAADNTVLVTIPFTVSNYANDNSTYYISTSFSTLLDINEDRITRYKITKVIDGLSYVERDPNEPPTEPVPTEAPEPTESPEPTEAPEPTEYYCEHWNTYTANGEYKYYDWGYTYNTHTYCSDCGQELYATINEVHYADTSKCLNFDATSAGWNNASRVLFYICDVSGEELYAWGSKKLSGTEGAYGIWSFDAESIGVEPGKQYYVIFNNYDTGAETYPLLFDTTCYGDTAKCTGSMIENPYDSNKSAMETRWQGSSLGPMLQITSLGNLVGDTVPANTTKYKMMVHFLASRGKDGLQNALQFNGKDAQTAIDDIASRLGLTKEQVSQAINEAKTNGSPKNGDRNDWSNRWDSSKSPLPGENIVPTESSTEVSTDPVIDSYGYVVGAYYLTGTINGENSGTTNVNKSLRFQKSTGDQMILNNISLNEGDVVRVARYNGGNTFTVYPDGVGRDIAITQSGRYDFYFKPYELGNTNYWYITPSYIGEITPAYLGDVDGDGSVTIVDATFIQRHLASIPIPFEFNNTIADTDEDGNVSIIDATYIQRWLASLKSNDNIGKPIT